MVCPERLDDKSKTTLKQSLFTRGKIMKKMNFRKIFPYNLKKMLPVLGIAGIGAVSSCEKPSPYQPEPAEVDVRFSYDQLSPVFTLVYSTATDYEYIPSDIVKYYVEHPDVKTINLVSTGDWSPYGTLVMSRMKTGLQTLVNYSPKIRGKGDFNFMPGQASSVPEDSLWFVQNGWTINKALQNQR